MARTEAGGLLTVRHRQGQIALRAQLLRDFQRIWPIWTGDESSFRMLVSATVPLVGAHRQTSSALATAYYEMFRRTEQAGGSPTPRPGDPLDEDAIRTSLYVTGLNSVKTSLEHGFTIQAAKQNAFVRVSGAVTRHMLNGGRDALVKSTASDPKAGGWGRVTSSSPCAFCAMLASRGAVYSEDTADFQSHDHCACEVEPQYEGSKLPGRADYFWELWQQVSDRDNPLQEFRQILTAAA